MGKKNTLLKKFIKNKSSGIPKYQQIAAHIENWILESNLEPGTKLPSDKQMVSMLGVTTVTIARALGDLMNKGLLERKVGSGTYICPKIRKKLEIGILSEDTPLDDWSFVSGTLAAISEYWQNNNGNVRYLIAPAKDFLKEIRENNLDGVIFFSPAENGMRIMDQVIALQKFPCVSIGVKRPELEQYSFGTDHLCVMRKAVDYLKKMGHEKIAVLEPRKPSYAPALRKDGYMKSMWENSLPVNPDWIYQTVNWKDEAACQVLKERLTMGLDAPTALIFLQIGSIMPFYTFAQKYDLRIPEDLSLIAFDDADYIAHLNPPLTVFAQKIANFTLRAMESLHAQIEHHPVSCSNDCNFELIERESVKNLKKKS